MSEQYIQAVFAGGGIAHAERLIKDPATAPEFAVVQDGSLAPRGNFEGLECRWQDIPSPRGETVSVMVKALAADGAALYRDLIARVREIYGSEEECHPVHPPNLAISLASRQLGNEAGVRAWDRGSLGRWRYLMKARFWVLVGWCFMKLGVRTPKTAWGDYKRTLVRNADVRKFNDGYRQVLAGTAKQREALAAWLEERFARGTLVYGIHVTDRALMTCLVFDYAGRHLHFIDGADGGYFLAARELKRRVSQLKSA